MMHSAPDRRLSTITMNQRGLSGNASGPVQSFITLGNITDITQITALNNLYNELVSANLWNKIQVLYPFVGGTATAHALNLKDATLYPLTFAVPASTVHNSNGVSGTASLNNSMSSNFDMGTLSANDFSFGGYARTPLNGSAGTSMVFFNTSTGSTYLIFRGDAFTSNTAKYAGGAISAAGIAGASTSRFMAVSTDSTSTVFHLVNQISTGVAGTKGSNLTGTISATLSISTSTFPWTYSNWYVATAMTETELVTLNAIFQKFNDTLDTAFGSTRGTDYWINPNYNAIVNRYVSNISITPFVFTTAELDAVNILVNSLINSTTSLWGSIGHLYPFIGSTLSAQTRNLKGLGTSATAATLTGTNWTFSTSTGLDSGAVTQVLSPSTAIALTSASTTGIYISDSTATNSDDVAQSASLNRFRINARTLANQAVAGYCGGSVASGATITDARGHYTLVAPGNTLGASFSFYRNGTLVGSSTVAATTSSGAQYFFGNGVQGSLRSQGIAYFTQGTQFSAAQIAELDTIIQAYVANLGRQ